jgi:hypothetical protein
MGMMKPNTVGSFSNLSNSNQNFSNNKTKELARKMKLKRDAEAKKKEEEKIEEEKKEAEKKEAEEQANKQEEVQQEAQDVEEDDEDDADISDSDSYESGEEEQNFDHLPQDRPKVIRYTKDMILEYITQESKREFEDELIFEDLVREISKVSKAAFSRGYRDNRRGGGRYDNYGGGYRKGGRRDGGYNSGKRYNGYESRGPKMVLERQKMSKEEKNRLESIRGDDKWAERNQENVDEIVKVKREINLKLFQVTAENFESCYEALLGYCDNLQYCEIVVDLLVDKAWSQPKYTKIYGMMCTQLGSRTYSWAEGKTKEENKAYCKKKFKSIVVNKIRNEFLQGFRKFKEHMTKWQKNPEINEDEFFEKYLKGKKKLTGNMSFISELYLLGYLPHKVMRFITYKLMIQFTDEFARRNDPKQTKLKFPIYNEYLEALIKLFEFSAYKINLKEKKLMEKEKAEGKTLCPYNKIVGLANFLVEACKNEKLDLDEFKKVIGDKERKEANCMYMTFAFFNRLIDQDVIETRMKSLIENLKDQEQKGWKRRTNDSGPKKLKDFHEEYQRKQQQKRQGGRRRDDDYRGGGGYRDRDRRGGYDDGGYYKKNSRNQRGDRRDDYGRQGGYRDNRSGRSSKYESYKELDQYQKKDNRKGG